MDSDEVQPVIIYPIRDETGIILRLDPWQLMEIKAGLRRIQKSRKAANKWVEKQRDGKIVAQRAPAKKAPLIISDIITLRDINDYQHREEALKKETTLRLVAKQFNSLEIQT